MRGADYQKDRQQSIEWAEQVLTVAPLFLDTETTGLDDQAEICDIAVIDYDGVVLFDTLVKPTKPIPDEASKIHGITDDMVKDAPGFADIADRLAALLGSRSKIVIYNASYDTRLMIQSAQAANVEWQIATWFNCAMHLFAQFYGDFNDYHRSYRWQSLGNAARHCGIDVPADIHRARVDAELTRRIVHYMAAQPVPAAEPTD